MPVIANFDASTTIEIIIVSIFIVASIFQTIINMVRSCFTHAMSNQPRITNAATSARCGVSIFKIRNLNFTLITAITPAKPMNFLSAATSNDAFMTNGYESAKSLASYVDKFTHSRNIT